MILLGAGGYWWIAIIGIVLVIAVIIGCMFWSYHNKFVKLRNNVEESFSTMDTYLQKRHDLIPNMVETVKGYAKHEKETLAAVIEARNCAVSAKTTEEKIKSEGKLNKALRSFFAVVEAYPDLKANINFMDLQDQLKVVEADIVNARKYYNAKVKVYNNSIQTFPGNLFAKLYNHKEYAFFIIEDEAQRKNIKVEF